MKNNKINQGTVPLGESYMYDDLVDYEGTVGYKVNEAFEAGWRMARMKWGPIIDKVESNGGEITFENTNSRRTANNL